MELYCYCTPEKLAWKMRSSQEELWENWKGRWEKIISSPRVIHLTESRWPKLVNMTKKLTMTNVNMVNLTENIINITTTTNVNGWIWPKLIFWSYSPVHVCHCGIIYYIFDFQSNLAISRSCSKVNVRRCEVLVKFQR